MAVFGTISGRRHSFDTEKNSVWLSPLMVSGEPVEHRYRDIDSQTVKEHLGKTVTFTTVTFTTEDGVATDLRTE